jgi:hypothetical protein
MQPDNAIIGDSSGIDLPELSAEAESLIEEKKMAKYSRSAEFKRIQDWAETRIAFYQKYLPNGAEVGVEVQPSPQDWQVANRVIAEFKLLLGSYDIAQKAVDDKLSTP